MRCWLLACVSLGGPGNSRRLLGCIGSHQLRRCRRSLRKGGRSCQCCGCITIPKPLDLSGPLLKTPASGGSFRFGRPLRVRGFGLTSVPIQWTHVQLAWVPKPNNRSPTSNANLRTIGLMGADTKAFLQILKHHADFYVQRALRDVPQYAYRSKASTADALLRASMHCEEVRCLLEACRDDLTFQTCRRIRDTGCGRRRLAAGAFVGHMRMTSTASGKLTAPLTWTRPDSSSGTLIGLITSLGMQVNSSKSRTVFQLKGKAHQKHLLH